MSSNQLGEILSFAENLDLPEGMYLRVANSLKSIYEKPIVKNAVPEDSIVSTPNCPYSFKFVGVCGDTIEIVVDSFIKISHPNRYNDGVHFRNIPKFRVSHNNSPPCFVMGHSGKDGVGHNELYNMINLIDARKVIIKYNDIEQVFKCNAWIKANEEEDEENREEDEDQEIFYDSSDFQRHFSDKINKMLSNWACKF